MRTAIAISSVLLALNTSACATTARGTVDYFYIITEPAGALATTSHNHSCIAPCTLILPRKDKFTVTISHEGYASWTGTITPAAKGANSPFNQSAVEDAATNVANAGTAATVGATGGVVAAEATTAGVFYSTAAPGVVFGAAAVGLVAPFAIDIATGANRDLTPNPLIVKLGPIDEDRSPS